MCVRDAVLQLQPDAPDANLLDIGMFYSLFMIAATCFL
jgi:hypothetical protein